MHVLSTVLMSRPAAPQFPRTIENDWLFGAVVDEVPTTLSFDVVLLADLSEDEVGEEFALYAICESPTGWRVGSDCLWTTPKSHPGNSTPSGGAGAVAEIPFNDLKIPCGGRYSVSVYVEGVLVNESVFYVRLDAGD